MNNKGKNRKKEELISVNDTKKELVSDKKVINNKTIDEKQNPQEKKKGRKKNPVSPKVITDKKTIAHEVSFSLREDCNAQPVSINDANHDNEYLVEGEKKKAKVSFFDKLKTFFGIK